MKLNFKQISNIYISNNMLNKQLGKYEKSIIDGVKKNIEWDNLSENDKLEFRKGEIVHKRKVKAIFSDKSLNYEASIIELTELILKFLNATSFVFDKVEEENSTLITLFRLRNMLGSEIYSINKHRNLKFGGHVPYKEVVKPIFNELKNGSCYKQYKLEEIRIAYQAMMELYELNPYKK